MNLIVALSEVAKPRVEHKQINSKEIKSNRQITTNDPSPRPLRTKKKKKIYIF